MKLTIRQLMTDDEIEAIVREAVETILDKAVTFSFIAEGVTDDAKAHVCPECGQAGFASAAALAGHRYWKHDVKKDSKKTVAQLKKESSVRTTARHKSKEKEAKN